MGVTVLALVILSSGYLFLRRWRITRPHLFRSDGHALYFSVVIAATVVAFEADLLRLQVVGVPFVGHWLTSAVQTFLGSFAISDKIAKLGETAFWSAPLVAITSYLLNLPIDKCSGLRSRLNARMSCLSELEEFLLNNNVRNFPVMLTLSSGKVYVGYSIESKRGRDDQEWVRIEPLLSGYRDDKHIFRPNTSYLWLHDANQNAMPQDVAKRLQKDDFDVIVPSRELRSVHGFDLNAYLSIFSRQAYSASGDFAGAQTSGVAVRPAPGKMSPLGDAGRDNGARLLERSSIWTRSAGETYYWGYFWCLLVTLPLIEVFGDFLLVVLLPLTIGLGMMSAQRNDGAPMRTQGI